MSSATAASQRSRSQRSSVDGRDDEEYRIGYYTVSRADTCAS